jgi:hypothetical protein
MTKKSLKTFFSLVCEKGRRLIMTSGCLATIGMIIMTQTAAAQMTGQELLRVTRVAQGGSQYAELQYVTAKGQGYINVGPFGAAALGIGAIAAIEIQFNLVDYQGRQGRRRLTVLPVAPLMGETYLVYDGNQGGGMLQGTFFRVSEVAMSRQWAMMGFDTLNQAADGQLPVNRRDDVSENGERYYVIDVRFTSSDTIQYWVNQRDFLIYKVKTRYNDMPIVEETRTDYRRASCLMLPFRVVTSLEGQRMADVRVSEYDLKSTVPSAYFTISEGR